MVAQASDSGAGGKLSGSGKGAAAGGSKGGSAGQAAGAAEKGDNKRMSLPVENFDMEVVF